MNELTIHGNITDKPILRNSPNGTTVLNFSVAVNRRRFDRQTGQWSDLPAVFHRVVAFNSLAENVANSPDIAKGTTVTVTGELADDSWTPEDGAKRYRTQLLASDIAASLRFATVTVTKNPRPDQGGGDAEEPSVPAARKRPSGKRLTVAGSGG